MRDWRSVATILAGAFLALGGCGAVLGLHVHAILGLLLSVGTSTVALVAVRVSIRHTRLARRLHDASRTTIWSGVPIQVVPGQSPVVAGLVRPRLYACGDLLAALPGGQRDAVIAHERSHRDHLDPLRLVALESIRRCLGWIPVVADVVCATHARLEIRADHDALADGATRQDLAAALLRLSASGSATVPGFGDVTDRRLRALLDDDAVRDDPVGTRPPWTRLLLTIAASAALADCCTSLLSGPHEGVKGFVQCLHSGCTSGP